MRAERCDPDAGDAPGMRGEGGRARHRADAAQCSAGVPVGAVIAPRSCYQQRSRRVRGAREAHDQECRATGAAEEEDDQQRRGLTAERSVVGSGFRSGNTGDPRSTQCAPGRFPLHGRAIRPAIRLTLPHPCSSPCPRHSLVAPSSSTEPPRIRS